MTYGFLPAAERLGLEVSLLTDQPEAHVRALTRAADVAAGWPAGTGPAGERALTSGAPGIERLLAGGTPGVVPCDVHDTRALIGRIAGLPAIRLLVKDFAGALIHHARLTGALGGAGPEPGGFGDQRLLAGSDDELADVFITITVHLCAGALAFGLARRGYAPLGELLAAVRESLAGALDREESAAARWLRARVLEADRLTGKAMVTAGTLTEKSRSGARDINKFYGPGGPNYLKAAR